MKKWKKLDEKKSLKAKVNPKILKIHTTSNLGNLRRMELQNARIKNVESVIIEGKSYTLEKTKTTFIINKNLSCNSKRVVYVIQVGNVKK